MRFALVDHDINYFTTPEQLENVYREIWDEIPVSLSVVPFHASTKSGAIPPEYWYGEKIFPIDKNKELVKFLKRKIREKKVSILMHGYSHKDYESGYEFEVGQNLYEKVKEGKRYLEKLFGVQIQTFAPPHNSLSRIGRQAIIANDLYIFGSLSFRPSSRPMEVSYFSNLFRKAVFRIITGLAVYPRVMKFKSYRELNCFSLVPSIKLGDLIHTFNMVEKYSGDFCLATHYWEMKAKMKHEPRKTQKDILEEFLLFVKGKKGVKFCRIDDLFVEK